MKFGRLVCLTVALLALPLIAYAQDATFLGTITDNTGGVSAGSHRHRDKRGIRESPLSASPTSVGCIVSLSAPGVLQDQSAELAGFTTATASRHRAAARARRSR